MLSNQGHIKKMDVNSLLKLAHDKSDNGRKELATELSDIYLGRTNDTKGRHLTDTETSILNQILMQLLEVAKYEIRQTLANDLAHVPTLSRALVLKLAKDDIGVANPVLKKSPVLDDKDLIKIAKEMGAEYQQAISKRPNISEDLASALIDAGNCEAVNDVLTNPETLIAPHSFDSVVDLACENPSLQSPLVKRKEMNAKSAAKLYWFAAEEIRNTIDKNFDLDPDLIKKSMDVAIQKLLDKFDPIKQKVTEPQKDLALKMISAGTIDADFLTQLLRLHQNQLFRFVLSEYLGLKEDIIDSIIDDTHGKKLAIVLKAKDFVKSKFATLFLLARGARTGEHVVNPQELGQTLDYFQKIEINKAKAVVQSWQKNENNFWGIG
jgi:hypothetical protein